MPRKKPTKLQSARSALLGLLAQRPAPPKKARRTKRAAAVSVEDESTPLVVDAAAVGAALPTQSTERLRWLAPEQVDVEVDEDGDRKGPTAPSYEPQQLDDGPPLPPIPDRNAGTSARIAHIVAVMSRGRWDGFPSRVPLAQAWGISDSRVRQFAAEASRMLYSIDDPAELDQKRRTLATITAQQRERAAKMISRKTELPDFGSVAKFIELEAKLLGIPIDNKRVELTGKDGGPLAVSLDDVDEALHAAAENDAAAKRATGGAGGKPGG